jgi:hypothetical protein
MNHEELLQEFKNKKGVKQRNYHELHCRIDYNHYLLLEKLCIKNKITKYLALKFLLDAYYGVEFEHLHKQKKPIILIDTNNNINEEFICASHLLNDKRFNHMSKTSIYRRLNKKVKILIRQRYKIIYKEEL